MPKSVIKTPKEPLQIKSERKKKLNYNTTEPLLQFFEDTNTKQKTQKDIYEKDLLTLTVDETPELTNFGGSNPGNTKRKVANILKPNEKVNQPRNFR